MKTVIHKSQPDNEDFGDGNSEFGDGREFGGQTGRSQTDLIDTQEKLKKLIQMGHGYRGGKAAL